MTQLFTPKTEIQNRINRFQELMEEKGCDLAIIRHSADLYYFAGTVQDGHLIIPVKGEPCFYVWRSSRRAEEESPLNNIKRIKNFTHLIELVKKDGFAEGQEVWTTFDVIPHSLFSFYSKKLFSNANFADCTHHIRMVRAIKSPWEIEQIRMACKVIDAVMSEIPTHLSPGIDELEFAACIEAILRKNGHQGFLRMRVAQGNALSTSQILTGPNGAIPSFTLTPAGGPGVSPSFGMGSGQRIIGPGEPVSVDLGGCFNGYLGDETRIFSIGALPDTLERGLDTMIELMERLEAELCPGVVAGDLYQISIDFMKSSPFFENFMGYDEKVQFIGHGLGIEIDEYPFISKDNQMILKPGMVLALEPKLIMPGLGLVGVEDTFLITEDGFERLTETQRKVTSQGVSKGHAVYEAHQ